MSGIDGFNPTHRVVNGDEEWEAPKGGEALKLCETGTPASRYTSADGRSWWLNDAYIEAIPPVTIVKGKRYRIEFVCEQDDYVGYVSDHEHITVEELPDPLPDTVDSVVLLVRDNPVDASKRQRISFQLDEDGWSSRAWRDSWNTETLQAEVGGPLNGELIVLFDANETEPQ